MKKSILFVFFAVHGNIFGMKVEEYKPQSMIQFFGSNVENPDNIVVLNQLFNDDKKAYIDQWWYLDHVTSHESHLESVCFENDKKKLGLATENNTNKSHKFTLEEVEKFRCIRDQIDGWAFSSRFDHPTFKQRIALGSESSADIFDWEKQNKLISFNHNSHVLSVFFNSTGDCLGTNSEDKKIRLFVWFKEQTIQQLMLRKIMNLWWQVCKPSKIIKSTDMLFVDITQLFNLDKDEIVSIWGTFPQNMQTAIWKTILKKIETYGKNIE